MFILVERRRRDKINAWIETLAKLIPDCSDDIKLNEVCLFGCRGCIMKNANSSRFTLKYKWKINNIVLYYNRN